MILDSDFVALLFDLMGVFARLSETTTVIFQVVTLLVASARVAGWMARFKGGRSGDSWIHGSLFCSIHE